MTPRGRKKSARWLSGWYHHLWYRAYFLLALRRRKEALEAAQQAVHLAERRASPRLEACCRTLLARVLLDLDRKEEALEETDLALSLWPECREAARVRARILLALGRGEEALRTLEALLPPEEAPLPSLVGGTPG